MAYVHVAHDCRIGDHVVLANAVNMGGHVEIADWAIVGGMTPVHQFVRIGTHSMVGGASRAAQDVPPFTIASGSPCATSSASTGSVYGDEASPRIRSGPCIGPIGRSSVPRRAREPRPRPST